MLLTAGAIHSPHLLLASGIGPKDQLKSFNIDTVSDLSGVGKNLQVQGFIFVCETVYFLQLSSWRRCGDALTSQSSPSRHNLFALMATWYTLISGGAVMRILVL